MDNDEIHSHTNTKKTRCRPIGGLLKTNALLIATVSCVVLGVVIGLSGRQLNPSKQTIYYVGFPGEIFMRMFKMLLLPLIASSMVSGIANLKGTSCGKLGVFTIGYYISTTLIAITIGIVLALTIKPGAVTRGTGSEGIAHDQPLPTAADTFLDLVRNLFPENILQAGFQHSKTVFTAEDIGSGEVHQNGSIGPGENFTVETMSTGKRWTKSVSYHNGFNVTGTLLFFALFGVMLNRIGEPAVLMVEFFNILSEITITMIRVAMIYCPIGIMFVIIKKILEVPDIAKAAQQLGMYMVTGLTGMAIHALLVLPAFYFLLTRQNAYKVSFRMVQALLIALGTSSSSAALPFTLDCCENKLKFNKNISRFVLPIGATINMDGLAIVQAITPVFIAQMNDRTLLFGEIITISFSATLASIGAGGVPGTGFITTLAIVVAAGLPAEDMYIVLTVDWFMMRMLTMVNIYGDALAAGVLTHYFARSTRSLED